MASTEILERVRLTAAQRILFLPHAVRQMARPERMITPDEVRSVVQEGALVEDYPEEVTVVYCLELDSSSGVFT